MMLKRCFELLDMFTLVGCAATVQDAVPANALAGARAALGLPGAAEETVPEEAEWFDGSTILSNFGKTGLAVGGGKLMDKLTSTCSAVFEACDSANFAAKEEWKFCNEDVARDCPDLVVSPPTKLCKSERSSFIYGFSGEDCVPPTIQTLQIFSHPKAAAAIVMFHVGEVDAAAYMILPTNNNDVDVQDLEDVLIWAAEDDDRGGAALDPWFSAAYDVLLSDEGWTVDEVNAAIGAAAADNDAEGDRSWSWPLLLRAMLEAAASDADGILETWWFDGQWYLEEKFTCSRSGTTDPYFFGSLLGCQRKLLVR